MRRVRHWIALLLVAAMLLGVMPVSAAEPAVLSEELGEMLQEAPPETLTEIPPEEPTETPPEESPEVLPEEDPDAELLDAAEGGASSRTVSTSEEFRAALANPDVDTILFQGSLVIGADQNSGANNHLEAVEKTIRPVDGDYENNRLSFAEGVTLVQVSSHRGNTAQGVEDQSISQIYGTRKNEEENSVWPDYDNLASLVPGVVGWYEYHGSGNSGDADAGMRVCYTMYCGSKGDAIRKAADLTDGDWNHAAADGTEDENRLFFVILSGEDETVLDQAIETEWFYTMEIQNGGGLTVQSGGDLLVRGELMVQGDLTVEEGGSLTVGPAGEATPYLSVWNSVVVEPKGRMIIDGTADCYIGGDMILGEWMPKPPLLVCEGEYIPCLAVDWGEQDYGPGIEMVPGEEYEVTFALCEYMGGDPGRHESYQYTPLDDTELAVLSIQLADPAGPDAPGQEGLRYERLETHGNNWTLTAAGAELGQQYEITCTREGKTYTLPVWVELPELGCYRAPEASPENLIRNVEYNPLLDANEFYLCVNPRAWFMADDSEWTLPDVITARGVRYDEEEEAVEVPGSVQCAEVEGMKGVWRVSVSAADLNAEFELPLMWNGAPGGQPDDEEPPVIGWGFWVDPIERLVCSESLLEGTSPYEGDPNSLDRFLTDENKYSLKNSLELTANTARDVVLYLLVYNGEAGDWICEYTGFDWAEGRDGVSLSEALGAGKEGFTRVTARWQGEEAEPHIARLDGEEISPDCYEPVPGSTRGIPLSVSVTGSDTAPCLMADWGGGNYSGMISMTPYDEYELSFVLCTNGTDYTKLSPDALVLSDQLFYGLLEGHGDNLTLAARNAEWNRTYLITYTESGTMYTLPVRVEMPELGCYRVPEAREDQYLTRWESSPLPEGGEFFVCVTPDAWFMQEGGEETWSLPENLTVKAWRDGDEETDLSDQFTCAPVEGREGVWRVTTTAVGVHVEFHMELIWAGEGEAPREEFRDTGLWIDASDRLVFSNEVLTGNPFRQGEEGEPEDLTQYLTEENREQLADTITLNPGAYRDVVLYLLVYNSEENKWTCEYTGSEWIEGRDGVALSSAPEFFTRVTAGSLPQEGVEPHIACLEGQEESENNYVPVPDSTRGIPLSVLITNTASGTMEASGGEKAACVRVDRTITVSGTSVSGKAPLYAVGYSADGQLISLTALTASGSAGLPAAAAYYRLIWTDEGSVPKCESFYEYLGTNE